MNKRILPSVNRCGRSLAALAIALVAVQVLPGCVLVAVRAVKAVDRAIDPPQALLVGTERFFGAEVTATARLVPLNAERRELWLKRAKERASDAGEDAEDGLVPGSAALEKTGARTMLVVTLRNAGAVAAQIDVVALTSARGTMVAGPASVALAPGQRVVLTPLGSEAEEKIDQLTVTVALKRGDVTETKVIELAGR